ncbi:MAG TPA: helix-turn-helix domain-containing protein [Dehalococcoidia bacterium]|nr:helix-turn-helix domain-containing protein [Dehalococcoidia bacterium]
MQKRYDQTCPVARTLDLVGDRWTLLIIRDLALGARRFSDFLANSPGLPPKVLSQRLKYLIEQAIVARTLEDGFPPRPRYELTERGETLLPVMQAIGRWGAENLYEGEEETRDRVLAAINRALPGFAG